jgi:hypothetical protein
LLTLVFAVPACQQLVVELGSVVLDDCADECEDGCEPDRCLGNCAHCACCKLPSVLSVAGVALPLVLGRVEPVLEAPAAIEASGYASPPFRPPTV